MPKVYNHIEERFRIGESEERGIMNKHRLEPLSKFRQSMVSRIYQQNELLPIGIGNLGNKIQNVGLSVVLGLCISAFNSENKKEMIAGSIIGGTSFFAYWEDKKIKAVRKDITKLVKSWKEEQSLINIKKS